MPTPSTTDTINLEFAIGFGWVIQICYIYNKSDSCFISCRSISLDSEESNDILFWKLPLVDESSPSCQIFEVLLWKVMHIDTICSANFMNSTIQTFHLN